MPQIGANDVLVKIRTAGVNPLDNMIIKGEVKMIVPYKMPLVMGNEFVGTGSLGAMAIPVAKSFGLTVITNGSAENRDRVLSLGADRFIDYKTEDYATTVAEVDYVLDTLGDRELPKEFGVLKEGGKLVSLRGMPNGEFAVRAGLPAIKRFLLKVAGKKYDKMAEKKESEVFLYLRPRGWCGVGTHWQDFCRKTY